MPTADITYHAVDGGSVPMYGQGGYGPIGVLGPQIGNSEQLDFTSPNQGAVQTAACVAVVLPDADARVTVGAAAATVANSRKIKSGLPEMFYVPANSRLGVRAG